MEKIDKYVVFKYEDEFGFHYMEMDKLPEEGPTYMEPISFEKKINPNCTPGAITQQPFSEDGNLPMCSAQNLSPCLVGGTTKPKFGNGRKGPGSIRPSRS